MLRAAAEQLTAGQRACLPDEPLQALAQRRIGDHTQQYRHGI